MSRSWWRSGSMAGGHREILGIREGAKEDKFSWGGFLRRLKVRGLKGVQLIVSYVCMGLMESVDEFFPDASWQRWVVGLLKKWLNVVLVNFSGV